MALSPEEDKEVRAWLGVIGNMLQAEPFTVWSTTFMREHCGSFDGAEENKLEHTELHAQFQDEVERRIGEAVQGTDVDLEVLMQRLPAFMKSAHVDEDPAVHEAIETLTSLSDFQSFKAAMLVTRQEGSGSVEVGAGSLGDVSAGETEREIQQWIELAQAMDAASEGWTDLVTKSWMCMSKRPAPNAKSPNDIIVRYVIDMDLPPEHVVNLMADYGERRRAYDENYASGERLRSFPVPASGGRDTVEKIKMKWPYLMRLAGAPETMTVRCVVRENQPGNGETTLVVAAWDDERGVVDTNNKFWSMALGVARQHPEDPARSRYTGVEQAAMGRVPDWVVGWLAGAFMPKYLLSMVDKYKRKVLASDAAQPLPAKA